jgi:hypothetical protein
MIFANPSARPKVEREDIAEKRRWRKRILNRLQPAHEMNVLMLLTTSAMINSVDDSR